MQKTTLKDIARHCGVTPTLVSAVLNRRQGTIACSADTRARIEAAARRMHYQANFFARSVRNRRVPVVGMVLHLEQNQAAVGSSLFINQCLTNMTLAFNRHKYEVLFIPYASEDEQVERLEHLLRAGLLGGIVTNILPDAHARISAFLRQDAVPYMVLGYPDDADVYCVYPVARRQTGMLLDAARARGRERAVFVSWDEDRLEFRALPFVDDFMYRSSPLAPEAYRARAASTLFVAGGVRTLTRLRAAEPAIAARPDGVLLVENEQFAHLVPPDEPVLLIRAALDTGEAIGYTVDALARWMDRGEAPGAFRKALSDTPDDYRYFSAGLAEAGRGPYFERDRAAWAAIPEAVGQP